MVDVMHPYRGAVNHCERCRAEIPDFNWIRKDEYTILRVVQGLGREPMGITLCQACTEELGDFMDGKPYSLVKPIPGYEHPKDFHICIDDICDLEAFTNTLTELFIAEMAKKREGDC